MEPIVPLPAAVRARLEHNTHPGLLIDKYAKSWDPVVATGKLSETVQRPTVQAVARLPQPPPRELDFGALAARHRRTLAALNAQVFECVTAGPLTLHLARASALENAGICLHPIYGFVYLPGTGLKGMARAYAETVAGAPKEEVEAVFGNEPGEPIKIHQRAGAVVFHDAWPQQWPCLIADIVNNHHPSYYQARPDDNTHAPGDWENPVPVYFLAVAPGTAFSFALAPRRPDASEGKKYLQLARDWLVGALCHLGAGAKTAAGYGGFRPVAAPAPSPASARRATIEATLELTTPAFLAGALPQDPADCDLRPAALRGLLRWWWRTMHVGYVDVVTLRRLEAALWGDTDGGAAVRLELQPVAKGKPVLYDKYAEARRNALPAPPNKKTTQGLWYLSYGMHDGGKQRYYLPPGSKWTLILTARDAHFFRKDHRGKAIPESAHIIPKEIILDQAQAALWWLCVLGGVGSKSRKGFGNLFHPPELDADHGATFVSKGNKLRQACGLADEGFKRERADSPALRQMVDLSRKVQGGSNAWIELSVPADNIWLAIDSVGMAAQAFAKGYKHRREKCALGLPRRIGNPAQGQFRAGQGVGDRHSSPVHYHLRPEGAGFVLRVVAFPSSRLPNHTDSEAMLQELLIHFLNTFMHPRES